MNSRMRADGNADYGFEGGDVKTLMDSITQFRWEIAWEEVKPTAAGQEDINPDTDIDYRIDHFDTWAQAHRRARQLVDGLKTAYGSVSITQQARELDAEYRPITNWCDRGDSETVA